MALTTGLVSYYKFDVDLTDALAAHDMTNGDAAPTQGAAGKISLAVDFTGSSRQSLKTTTPWVSVSPGLVSVSAWIKIESLPDTVLNDIWAQSLDDGNGTGVHLAVQGSASSATMRLAAYCSPSMEFPTNPYGSTTLSTGVWYHVVWTYDPASGSPHCMYVNGVAETVTNDQESMEDYGDGTSNCIGAYLYTTVANRYNWDGVIDEIGVWNRVLTPAEVTELYNGGSGLQYPFTQLLTGIVSYYKFDTDLTDSLGAHNMSNGDAAPTAGVAGKISLAVDFEHDSRQSLKTTTQWVTSGPISVSAWINRESQASIFNAIFGQTDGGNGYGLHLGFMGSGGGGTAHRFAVDSNTAWTYPTIPFGSTTLSLSTWYHVVWTYDAGASPKHRMYVDGVEETVTNNNLTVSDWGDGTSNCIGAYWFTTTSDRYNFDGVIDELGVWDRVLSGAEAAQLYNSGTGLQYPFGVGWAHKLNGISISKIIGLTPIKINGV